MKENEMKELMSVEKREGLKQKLDNTLKEGNIILLCAIQDKRAESFENIFTAPSKAFATRGFMDACKNEQSPFAKYPEDFRLVVLGYMNQKSGKIEQQSAMEILIEASSVVAKQ